QLITAILASAFTFSAHCVMADVTSVIEADIDANSRGDIEATATQMGGNNNTVEADATVVGIEIDASERTDITSEMDLNIAVRNRGDITAEATNMGGNNNEVEANAAVVSIDIDSGGN
ncbi:hypothetical protein QUF54_08465, partial [Candidatus Marithioploca araucensis]|nr:hypothetical protein [Candidatus Marithioploca araucensis]